MVKHEENQGMVLVS